MVNLGYNGSKGSNLDVVGSPNGTPSGTTTPGVAPFDYEYSAAASHANALVVAVQKRQQKGIALSATYTYSHSIDNASGVGGVSGTPDPELLSPRSRKRQLHLRPASQPQRQLSLRAPLRSQPRVPIQRRPRLQTPRWLLPLRHLQLRHRSLAHPAILRLRRPGRRRQHLHPCAPTALQANPSEAPAPSRTFFNTAAFTAPAAGQYGNASPGSIEGPGTVQVSTALSRAP